MMPLEPRLRPIVAIATRLPVPGDDVSFAERRSSAARLFDLFSWTVMAPGPKVARRFNVFVPVEGGQITVRVYQPRRATGLPLHVFLHGGGWCEGTLSEREPRCRALAVDADRVVASVEYRLAPECQYPTAPEDCYAALCWLVEHADELGVDPEAVTVGGESAGGNLAAVVALMARDRGGPSLALQILDVPSTDLTFDYPSVDELGEGYLLTRGEIDHYVENYLPDNSRATEPYASPWFAADLSGLPPALVMTAEYDPLRDDGERYARRLADSGVEVEHIRLAGHVHPSFALTRLLPSAREYHRTCVAALQRATAARS